MKLIRFDRAIGTSGRNWRLACAAILLGLINFAQAQDQNPANQNAAQQSWTVNFKEADIQELVRFVADATGKTMVVDPSVKGRVQVISSRPVESQDELYSLFLSILEIHGFTAIELGNVVRIIPSKDARTAPVPVNARTATSKDSEIVTEVIKLENISAAQLISVLRPMVPQQAYLAAYVPSNAIIISDSAANITRIRQVIENIDRNAEGSTELIQLRFASADEVVRMVEQLHKRTGAGEPEVAGKGLLLVADKRTNSVLVSGDELERQEARDLIERLDTPLAQSGNVRVIYLKYAKATELAAVLNKVVTNVQQMSAQQDLARPNSQATASIEADEGTNALIITADGDVMQSLMSVIDRLDIRRAQVLVEAIIVEIADEDARALGLQWLFIDQDGGYGSSSADNGILAGTVGAAFGGSNDEAAAALAANLARTPGQIFGFGDRSDNLSFNVVLNALNKISDTNILSTPSLLTLDNQEASIVVGKNVPFVTGSFTSTGNGGSTPNNPFQTIQREAVGITLKVTPHINEGDSMVLEIAQEVSSLSGDASQFSTSDVITNERKIQTKILVDNGQTVILGGLIQDDVRDSELKVPLLGDIPLLGRLFRSNSVTISKTHLMVFLRPTIIRDSRTLDGATGEKYRYLREQQQRKIDQGIDLIDSSRIPILPEWEEQLRRLEAIPEPDIRLNPGVEPTRPNFGAEGQPVEDENPNLDPS